MIRGSKFTIEQGLSKIMNYGYFDDSTRDYVITNPKTPVKWVNYVGTLGFGGIVDHTGGSLLCKGDPAVNRIVKYIPQLPSSDFKGETLYIRYRTDAGYKVFSPFFVPTLDPYDFYECRVGLSYQKITSEFYGLRTEVTVFVPIGSTVCLRKIVVKNVGQTPKNIDVIPVIEYTHPDALKQFTNADWVPQTMTVKAKREASGHVILEEYPFFKENMAINYHTSNFPVSSFQTDRKKFLGDNEYGTWRNPLELHNPQLSNFESVRGDNITALLHTVGLLEPGQSMEIITQLGQADSLEKPCRLLRNIAILKRLKKRLQNLALFGIDICRPFMLRAQIWPLIQWSIFTIRVNVTQRLTGPDTFPFTN